MKPMLAHHYTPKRAVFPCFGQPKLNGVRALWLGNYLISRGRPEEPGVQWHRDVLPHIHDALETLTVQLGSTICLDGELYVHGLSLQQINRRVAVKRVNTHEDVHKIKYNIFDVIHHSPFSKRKIWLEKLHAFIEPNPILSNALSIVPTTYINSPSEAEAFYRLQRSEGYEGAMYRDPSAIYGMSGACGNKENRWKCLLKRKEELDIEGIIVGIELGKPGKAFADTMGALLIELPGGKRFLVGSGVQIQHRHLIEQIINELITNRTRVRICYDEMSDSGIPLRGRIECIYDERF